jgi:hypothetical protein
VVAEIAALLNSYNIREVTGDHYAADWVTDGFSKELITYEQSERDKSKLYLDALPLFTSGRARLVDNERLVHQLTSLERRASRVGRDIVSHPNHTNAHDDLANACAGALVLVTTDDPGHWRAMATAASRYKARQDEAALANGVNNEAHLAQRETIRIAAPEADRQQREIIRLSREQQDAQDRSRRDADIRNQLLRAVGGDQRWLWGRGIG